MVYKIGLQGGEHPALSQSHCEQKSSVLSHTACPRQTGKALLFQATLTKPVLWGPPRILYAQAGSEFRTAPPHQRRPAGGGLTRPWPSSLSRTSRESLAVSRPRR